MPRMRLLCLLLLSAFLLHAQAFPRPQWLHYPEPDAEGIDKPRYFWTQVDVPPGTVKAELFGIFDDAGEVLVDGKPASDSLKAVATPKPYPSASCVLTSELAPGASHRLELQCTNAGGIGGVLARLVLTQADGSVQEVFTNPTHWRTAKRPSYQGGMSEGVAPLAHGDLTHSTWVSAGYDTELLYSEAERAVRLRQAEAQSERRRALREKLSREKKQVASIEYSQGGARIRIGDTLYPAILYNAHAYQNFGLPGYRRNVENFRDAGLNLFVMGATIASIWKGPGEYDFRSIDQWPYDALLTAPDAHILFDLNFYQPPKWWLDAHPEELVKYLRPADEAADNPRDICYGKFPYPSFASERYRSDLMALLRALVEHIEAQPWGARVFGYRFDMGIFMEWHHPGMTQAPDDSEPMRRRFRKFLADKYRTDAALQRAWGDPSVTLENATMASYRERCEPHAGNLYDPRRDARALDSVTCVTEAMASLLLEGDRVIKESCHRRCLVGNYYGYLHMMSMPAVVQHPFLQRLLESPDVDFTCQPPSYWPSNRRFGGPQLGRGLTGSHRLYGKLNLMEADTRTHLTKNDAGHTFVQTPEQSVQQLARDFAQALCAGFGFWYFDFGQGWYDDPQIAQFLKRLRPIWMDESADNRSAAEVAIAVHMEEILCQAPDVHAWNMLLCDYLRLVLSYAGIPYDTVQIADLENPALNDYKVVVFLNDVVATPERVALAERLRARGKTLVWLQQAGFLSENGCSASTVRQLTGFSVEELPRQGDSPIVEADGVVHPDEWGSLTPDDCQGQGLKSELFRPFLAIRDGSATPLLWSQQECVFARKTNPSGIGESYLATCPLLNPADFRELFRRAGVHIYCDDPSAVVYANRSYLMLHVANAGEYRLRLPRECRLRQLLPEERLFSDQSGDYILNADENKTYLFRMEEPTP